MMSIRTIPLILVTIITLFASCDGHKNIFVIKRLYIENMNPKIITNITQSFKLLSRNRHSLNATVCFANEHFQTFLGRLTVERRIHGVYMPFLLNSTFDYCAERLRKEKSPTFKLVEKYFKKYSTLNGTCPVKAPVIVHDYHIESDHLPQVVPNGEYRARNIFYTKDSGKLEPLVDLILILEIRNKNDFYDLA